MEKEEKMVKEDNNIAWILAFFILCGLAVTGYVVSNQQNREAIGETNKAVSTSMQKSKKKFVKHTRKINVRKSPARIHKRVISTAAPRHAVYYPAQPRYSSYTRDLAECRMYAQQVAGYTPEQTVKGGLIGGAVGAAAGAAIGAVLGHAGKGAAIGAAAGGIGAGTYSAISAERKYKKAYARCMRQRGYRVLN